MSSLPSITGESSSTRLPASLESYIQPTLGNGLRIWWALYWRTSIIGVVLIFALGVVTEILSRAGMLSFGTRQRVIMLSPYVFGAVAAFFVMHYVVRKRFRGFRISLMAGEEVAPTRARTTRIWWTYTWRSLVYLVVVSLVANIPLGFVMMAAAAVSPAVAKVVQFLVGLILNGVVGLFVIYSSILDEDIAGFRVSLAPADKPADAVSGVPATF